MFKLSRLFQSDLPDHHKLISVFMKSGIFHEPPQKKVYRSYKNVGLEDFDIVFKSKLEKLNDSTWNEFEMAFCSVLNKHAPIIVKMLRHNYNSLLTKILRKTIMARSKFKKSFQQIPHL